MNSKTSIQDYIRKVFKPEGIVSAGSRSEDSDHDHVPERCLSFTMTMKIHDREI